MEVYMSKVYQCQEPTTLPPEHPLCSFLSKRSVSRWYFPSAQMVKSSMWTPTWCRWWSTATEPQCARTLEVHLLLFRMSLDQWHLCTEWCGNVLNWIKHSELANVFIHSWKDLLVLKVQNAHKSDKSERVNHIIYFPVQENLKLIHVYKVIC